MNRWLIAGGAALVGLSLLGGKKVAAVTGLTGLFGRAFDFTKAQAFALALPSQVRPYASQFLASGQKWKVDPWALAALCYGESLGGQALKPPGPGGTGDFIPRDSSHPSFKFANPATGLPPDGKGWGRGLMQLDYGSHNAWVVSSAWWEPSVNIDKAASLLRERLDFFAAQPRADARVSIDCWRIQRGLPQYGIQPWKDKYPNAAYPPCAPTQKGAVGSYPDPRPLSGALLYEAAVASYNVGYAAVLQALALGIPAEAGTANQSYVTKFMSRVAGWMDKLS